jgi:thiol-disulfide isomerase/thioredoxin
MTEPPAAGGNAPRRRAIVAAAAVAALALGAGVAWWLRTDPSPAKRDASALLEIALPDAAGVSQPLAQWRGKVLVVNFWATWCAPCREEMPMFIAAQEKHGPRGLQFVGIAVDEAAKVKQFASEIGLNYPALIGGYGAMELSRTLGNQIMALPFTIVVDRQGGVALTQLGPVKPAQLDQIIALTR